MSLTDRHTSIMIGLAAHVGSGTPALISEEPTLNSDSWDTLVQLWTIRAAALTAETLAAYFPAGAQLGSRLWWVVGAKPTERARGFWTVTVTYKGAAATKPAVVQVGASATSQSGTNVGLPGGGTAAKLETHQNTPTISVTYWTADVMAAPLTASVGTAITPPVTVPVPSNVWASLSDPVTHFPSGWVLMASAQNRIPGSVAAEVTDSYQYIQTLSPGG
jgi:hypothetical protein